MYSGLYGDLPAPAKKDGPEIKHGAYTGLAPPAAVKKQEIRPPASKKETQPKVEKPPPLSQQEVAAQPSISGASSSSSGGWSAKFMAPPVRKKPVAPATLKLGAAAKTFSNATAISSPSNSAPPTTETIIRKVKEAVDGSVLWWKDVKNPYNPERPNDYEEFLTERTRKRKDEELKERLRKQREETERAQPTAALNISGAEAHARRARLSQAAAPPSPAAELELVSERPREPPKMEFAPPPAPANSFAPPQKVEFAPPPPKDPAKAMMEKMGWKEGEGLGKDGHGMKTPLMAKKTDRAQAVIMNAPQVPVFANSAATATADTIPLPPEKRQKAVTFRGRPSKVLLLKNMVGPGDVDDDLPGELYEECSKYGEVVRVLIFEVKDGSTPETEAVRIFVKFAKQAVAMKAYLELNDRFFGGRTVWVCFYPEARFEANDLAPGKDEPR